MKTRLTFLGLALVAGLFLSYFRAFELYELQTYDLRCQIRGQRPVSDRVVLVDIWDDTLAQLGAWPFDREYHASLIETLSQCGVKAVVFDVLFSEEREHDQKVVSAAEKAGNVYFPIGFSNFGLQKGRHIANKIESDLLPGYQKVARGVGFVNTKADKDGKRRRTMPVLQFDGQNYYQLSFRVAMDLLGVRPEDCLLEPGKYFQLGQKLRVPLDDDSCFNISYAGQWEKTFRHVSYLDILYSAFQASEGQKPRVDLNSLKDTICIVGLTSQGSHDISPVPIQSVYPMVGSYANIVNNILMKDFISRVNQWINLLILVFLGSLVAWFSIQHKPIRALVFVMAVITIFVLVAIGLFFLWGVWIDLFYPMIAMIVIYAVCTFMRSVSEIKKREILENELKIASQIQKSFLPESVPVATGFSTAVFMKPAKAVGGDLYAFLKISEKKIGVMIGDVSGKGTPAALFMAKTVSEFKFSARGKLDPGKVLEELNESVSSESTGGLFVTISYGLFDLEAGRLSLANGGHLPVAVASQGASSELIMAEEGIPIGVMGGVSFGALARPIKSGEVFAFYSDGISEARNRKKEEYGVERLQAMLTTHVRLTAQQILDRVMEDLHAFMGKAEQHDDLTLILVKIGDA